MSNKNFDKFINKEPKGSAKKKAFRQEKDLPKQQQEQLEKKQEEKNKIKQGELLEKKMLKDPLSLTKIDTIANKNLPKK
jgi:hypothetical protein